MTDLQLGLLVIGALAVAGVFVYNRLQERSARSEAERAFASRHPDVLGEAPAARAEPTLERQPVQPPRNEPLPALTEAMPDERVDYIVDLALAHPAPAATIFELWAPIERRFARRVLLAGSDGHGWKRLRPGTPMQCLGLRAALQLVSRAGVVADAELVEFRSAAETMAAKLGASVSAPEMRESLEAARSLDAACADADIQVALHVTGAQVTDAALTQHAGAPFQVARQGEDIILTLDVPRAPDLTRSYEAMARAARHLAGRTGRLVDDRGRALDDASLAAIGGQLEPARRILAERGIEPGSPLALRLFS